MADEAIIDIHTHAFPPAIAGKALARLSANSQSLPFTDGTLPSLRKSMEEAGIALSVVLPVATHAGQVTGINDMALKMNEAFQGGEILFFASIHPEFTNYREELARMKRSGIRGIKVHPFFQEADLDDIRYLRIFERAAELGLLVAAHAGLDIGFPGQVHASPGMARHALDEVGDFPFLLAHMGGWGNWDEAVRLAGTSVYIDTSFSIGARKPLDGTGRKGFMGDEEALSLIRAFGAGHVLFGSDSPWSSQKESLEALERLPLDEDEKQEILGGNARRLLAV